MSADKFTMEEYSDVIKHVNECIRNDNRDTWWPKIIRIEGGKKIHLINGIEAGASGSDGSSFGDASSNALLRIVIDEKLPCTLFAYDVKCNIHNVDIIVGFLDKEKNLTLAWDKRVYPMIGISIGNIFEDGKRKFIDHNTSKENMVFTKIPNIPENTKWIIACSLNTKNRKIVALYGRTRNITELKNETPEF